jgi:hypothetical protein
MIGSVFDETLTAAIDAGLPLIDALEIAVRAEWRGADEEVQSVDVDVQTVRCVCGKRFSFRDGATRARCPGCGARYQKDDTKRGGVQPSQAG